MHLTVKDRDLWDEIVKVWGRIVHAPTAAVYEEQMMALHGLCGEKSEFVQYINKNWLPLNHKFIKFHIDKFMHLGNTTTNR